MKAQAFLCKEEVDLILTKNNISRGEFAKKVGTTSGYMTQLLNGNRAPSPEIRRRIIEALRDYIIFDKLFYLVRR